MSKVIFRLEVEKSDLLTYALSIILSTTVVILFLFNSNELFHSFIIPVYFSGILIGLDLIDWLRGRIEIFDPVGFIGVFGYHFFFLAPILQIYWGAGMGNIEQPEDWRTWLLGIGIINLIGLILYRYFRTYFLNSTQYKVNKWVIDTNKLLFVSIPVLIVMLALQTYVYISYGGISGYINTYTSRDGGFEGMGFLFMVAESFPIIFLIVCIHLIQKSKFNKSMIIYFSLFVIFLILKMYFGGLRGSRSNTLWGIIWFAGIFHCFVKPLKKKIIILGSIFVLLFIFVYGIYKGSGDQGLDIFNSDESIMEIADDTNRGIDTLLLGDLSRIRTQAFILHKLIEYPDNYNYALGRSYIGDLSILIPQRIYPNRQPTKVKEGTEIILGSGNYNPNGYVSSRIYGLTGEFMLNFGYLFAPFTFIILAFFIGKVREFYFSLNDRDARLYIYPFFVIMCFLILVQDLDNLVYSIVKNLMIPYLILLLVKQKHVVQESRNETFIRT